MDESPFEICYSHILIVMMFGITCFIQIDSPWSFDLSAAALAILVCTSTSTSTLSKVKYS